MKALQRLRFIFNKFIYKVAIKPVKEGLYSLAGFSFTIDYSVYLGLHSKKSDCLFSRLRLKYKLYKLT